MPRALVVAIAAFVSLLGTAVAARPQSTPPPPPSATVSGSIQSPASGLIQTPAPRDAVAQAVRRVPIGTSTLSGTVVDASTGRPLSMARVTITGQVSVAGLGPRGAGIPGRGLGPGTGGGDGRGGRAGAGPMQGTVIQTSTLSRAAVTDARGRFTFASLPAGQFTVSVGRDQYLNVIYGQSRPNRPGVPVRVADGATETITVRLPRGGVIAGTVFSDDGAPEVGARVQAMRFSYAGGVRRLTTTSMATTDDRGVYRIFGMQPGDYIVSAVPSMARLAQIEQAAAEGAAFEAALRATLAGDYGGSRPTSVAIAVQPMQNAQNPTAGYAPTYFPGTATVRDAAKVAVGAGDEKLGVDITTLPVRAGNVSGVVGGLPGPEYAAQVMLVSDDPLSGVNVMGARTAADGTFMIRGVMPGRYTAVAQVVRNVVSQPQTAVPTGSRVSAVPQINPAERLWGRAEVVVEGQSTHQLSIALQPPKSISGSVVLDMERPVDLSRARLTVSISPAPSAASMPQFNGMPTATVDAEGRFTLAGVVPGTYSFRISGATARSAIVNGVDVLDFSLVVGEREMTGMVVTLSDRATNLSGTLTDPLGQDPAGYTIVVAPSDRRYWVPGGRRIRVGRPDSEGRYSLSGLPAGGYLIAAVTDLEPGTESDPEFLQALAGAAIAVTLTDGGSTVQDIRVAR